MLSGCYVRKCVKHSNSNGIFKALVIPSNFFLTKKKKQFCIYENVYLNTSELWLANVFLYNCIWFIHWRFIRGLKSFFIDQDRRSFLLPSVLLCDGHTCTFPLQEELCVVFTHFTYSVAADGCWIHYNHTGLLCCHQTYHVACITKQLVCLPSLATRINSCFSYFIWG